MRLGWLLGLGALLMLLLGGELLQVLLGGRRFVQALLLQQACNHINGGQAPIAHGGIQVVQLLEAILLQHALVIFRLGQVGKLRSPALAFLFHHILAALDIFVPAFVFEKLAYLGLGLGRFADF